LDHNKKTIGFSQRCIPRISKRKRPGTGKRGGEIRVTEIKREGRVLRVEPGGRRTRNGPLIEKMERYISKRNREKND